MAIPLDNIVETNTCGETNTNIEAIFLPKANSNQLKLGNLWHVTIQVVPNIDEPLSSITCCSLQTLLTEIKTPQSSN